MPNMPQSFFATCYDRSSVFIYQDDITSWYALCSVRAASLSINAESYWTSAKTRGV